MAPEAGLDGRFSVEYAMAVALLARGLSLKRFADGPLEADAEALLPRIHRRVDHDVPSIGEAPEKRFVRVDVHTFDGRHLQRTATRVHGTQDLGGKFLDATAGLDQAARIPALVATMQTRQICQR